MTPIWSDRRGAAQSQAFLNNVGFDRWYSLTGRDDAATCSFAKIMWFRNNESDVYEKTWKFLPTKDYINFRMTGICATDPSDASGSGIFNLMEGQYSDELLATSGIRRELFPKVIPSTAVIGGLTQIASEELGLPRSVKVVCGGGDTCCMALGAMGIQNGRSHTSLGSSAFIAITIDEPHLDSQNRLNHFAHVIPEMFTLTRNVHSAGNSFRWVRDVICSDFIEKAKSLGADPYALMDQEAKMSPPGADRLIFNPTLAMSGPNDSNPYTKGAFIGLDLHHKRKDLIRAAMEGIAMNLAWNLLDIRKFLPQAKDMLLVGGGSESGLWRQIFADVFDMRIIKTNIGQEACGLGCLALAAAGMGFWKDFARIDTIHRIMEESAPIPENAAIYKKIMNIFIAAADYQAKIGQMLAELDIRR
jgi:xylulokinase